MPLTTNNPISRQLKSEMLRLNKLENFNGLCPVCLSQMNPDEEKNEWLCPKCTYTVPHFPITIKSDSLRTDE